MEKTLLIRADASIAIGTGHVMRCLALAQAWQDRGGSCILVARESTPSVERRLKEEGIQLECITADPGSTADSQETVRIASHYGADWTVADGYQFDANYQKCIKSAGLKLLFIDDYGHAESYSADLILNHNLLANRDLYSRRKPGTQLLLGPRYAMLRREFLGWHNWRREIPEVGRKILVTMGGSDPENVTAKIIQAIQTISQLYPSRELQTTVLVGGSNPHRELLEGLVRNDSIRLIIDVNNIPCLMSSTDVAIAGAGTTFWEMCYLGLPSLLLVLAENQKGVATAAESAGAAWHLGTGTGINLHILRQKLVQILDSREIREGQCRNGRSLVDGRGAQRVIVAMSDVSLRLTNESDCEVFWEWASDPEARAVSFRNKTISWESHLKWFRAKIIDPKAVLYTATDGRDVRIGQVRFQIEGPRAVLSITLGAQFRGYGFGGRILNAATKKIFSESEVKFIDAFVKPTNEPSLRLFSRSGFRKLPSELIEGQEGIHFVLERNNLE